MTYKTDQTEKRQKKQLAGFEPAGKDKGIKYAMFNLQGLVYFWFSFR
jgi:hypothetical protein